MFQLETKFQPEGDQPEAIGKLTQGLQEGLRSQVLLGVTGSGKTFTMANVIARVNRPALIIAHNKTLAAQLYQEFKAFFPNNAVEYFVSYYDYYQPEAYIARTDTYIEKDFAINDKIDKLRLSATRSLLERNDVIIVASVSCIYGLGIPEFYRQMSLTLEVGQKKRRDDVLFQLVEMQYKRSDLDLTRATFRSRGDVLDIFPAYEDDYAIRVEFFDDEIERISEIDPLTCKKRVQLERAVIWPSSHFVTPEEVRTKACQTIKQEMLERKAWFESNNKLIEAQRIFERVTYDIEMIKEVGFCKGIENYSRHFSERTTGLPPPCLIDYFPKDFLLIVDESHQTVPQISAMSAGDRARKESLIEFGFRLPSAYDNRPLRFEEFQQRYLQAVFVSATPSKWEVEQAAGRVIEQIIRPTGLLDPVIEVRPATHQVDDALEEIRKESLTGGKTLVTTLTKHLAEELTKYLNELGVKARYLHSDIVTLERLQIIHELRTGQFDVLVGINLLREGLDLPEVSLVVVLDADKEGFLRSETSLIQISGRAARNIRGRVVMYADTRTASIKKTLEVTERRRAIQKAFNDENGIIPKSTKRESTLLDIMLSEISDSHDPKLKKDRAEFDLGAIQKQIKHWEAVMKKAAKEERFEDAISARDTLQRLNQIILEFSGIN